MAGVFNLDHLVEFAENQEPRCPCVLLLDTSGSMQGDRIAALNAGLQTFGDDLRKDTLASLRVEIAIVTFDSEVSVRQDFITADQFEPPVLSVQGTTMMAAAINRALDMVAARKAQYRSNGIAYYRPWVFLITDGAPTDAESEVNRAADRLTEEEDAKRVAFFAVGVEGADMGRLGQIVRQRAPVKLKGLDFREMFLWLSSSMQRVSSSKPDDQVALPPPGWGTV